MISIRISSSIVYCHCDNTGNANTIVARNVNADKRPFPRANGDITRRTGPADPPLSGGASSDSTAAIAGTGSSLPALASRAPAPASRYKGPITR